jgi:hypothetical protein
MLGTWKSGEYSLMAELCFIIAPNESEIIVKVLYNSIQDIMGIKREKMDLYSGMSPCQF